MRASLCSRAKDRSSVMQTLRFYTRRVFALICAIFFLFLLLMASRRDVSVPLSAEFLSSDPEIPADYLAKQNWRGFRAQPKNPDGLRRPPGEQLPFQPQPPPGTNSGPAKYADLMIDRKIDRQLVDRIKAHLNRSPIVNGWPECRRNTTLAEYWHETQGRTVPKQDNWEHFYAQIGSCDLYRDERMIDALLKDLNKLEIKHTAIMEGGTQVKLILTFDNDKQAVFKPMRFGRDYETDPNHFYFGDFERHNAEIATFHLDKILGYRRAVPTVGRVMNMTSELLEKAERRLRKTFFVSPAKNRCFVSKCDYYCDTTHAICGSPELKEGSVQVFLPDDTSVPRKHNKSPYRRTYSKKTQLAAWQQDMNYCHSKVKGMKQYAHGRRLLDLIDLHLMDYLIGNQDRHHYETFSVFGTDIPSYAIHLDNGRSFGRTDFDDDDILMPFRQCCLIRPKTLGTFFGFYSGVKGLSETLHDSLSKDPVFPVIAFKHYAALERRLHKIMEYLLECMDKQNGDLTQMVVNEFHNPTVAEPLPGEESETEEDETNDAPAGPPADQQQKQREVGAAPAEAQHQPADENENAKNVLKAPAAEPILKEEQRQSAEGHEKFPKPPAMLA
ncbi:hypothetical protein niasHS_007397 [Heterodera schachtii]|uniref:FAM20 C-terminal domain-containing protein n=1 Tax=Heterodera schachtii TaxID=97005 RepID=A0ABD2JXH6_HETSC